MSLSSFILGYKASNLLTPCLTPIILMFCCFSQVLYDLAFTQGIVFWESTRCGNIVSMPNFLTGLQICFEGLSPAEARMQRWCSCDAAEQRRCEFTHWLELQPVRAKAVTELRHHWYHFCSESYDRECSLFITYSLQSQEKKCVAVCCFSGFACWLLKPGPAKSKLSAWNALSSGMDGLAPALQTCLSMTTCLCTVWWLLSGVSGCSEGDSTLLPCGCLCSSSSRTLVWLLGLAQCSCSAPHSWPTLGVLQRWSSVGLCSSF